MPGKDGVEARREIMEPAPETLVPSHDPAIWETFNPAPYRYT